MVNEGPFADYTGAIEEIGCGEEEGYSVLVDMFGRETPVELDFHQLKNYKMKLEMNCQK